MVMIINSTLVFCLVPELENALVGLKITEVFISSDQRELFFRLRDKNRQTSLYFSAHPLNCRIEIWDKEEAKQHIQVFQKTNLFGFATGGYIRKIEQVDFDRVIKIACEKKSQFGVSDTFALIFELTGRNSNVVLAKKDEVIVDCLRKIDVTQNRFRQILPGTKYVPPPTPIKKNPFAIRKEELTKLIKIEDQSLSEWLRSHFTGVDTLVAQKIVIESSLSWETKTSRLAPDQIERLWESFSSTFERLSNHHFSFQIIKEKDGIPQAISCVDLPFIPEDQKIRCPNLNFAVKSFFTTKLEGEKRKKEVHKLSAIVHQALEKLRKREKKIEVDFKQAKRFEEYKRFGGLLMMNKENIKKGQSSVKLVDVFDPQHSVVEIPLDSKFNAIKNALVYFKRYRKAKDALGIIEKRRSGTKELIAQLEKISNQLSLHGEKINLEEQKQNLIRMGFLKEGKPQTKKTKAKDSSRGFIPREFSPRRFVTKSGWEILVGRNNKENDYLTFKFAHPDDLWFHAQDVPGSHVLLRRKDKKSEPSSAEIKESAKVAAYFSKAKKEKKAQVIYTQAKYVRKPKRGKPGLALVQKEKSILVEPRLPTG